MALNYLEQRRRGLLMGNQGKIVLWNQLLPDFFDTSESWWNYRKDTSITRGAWDEPVYDSTEQAYLLNMPTTATSGDSTCTFYCLPANSIMEQGHIYFSNTMVKIVEKRSDQNPSILTRFGLGNSTTPTSYSSYQDLALNYPTQNEWINQSVIFTYNLARPNSSYTRNAFIITHVNSSRGGPFSFLIKAPTLIDLTKMFEKQPDLMPTVEEADNFYQQCISNNINLNSYQPRNVNGTKMIWQEQ